MKLTRRQLSLLIENYLIAEGRKDRDWIKDLNITDEDKALYLDGESQGLKIQDMSWIHNNRGEYDLFHSINSVLKYKKIPEAFKQNLKVKAERIGDATLLKKLNLSGFDSIQSLDEFISESDQYIEDSSALSRKKFVPLETGDDLEIVGEAGPWTVILPTTIRGSVSCDYTTPKETTWCTTVRSGQNLFYHYVSDGEVDIMLFYIMDYTRSPSIPGNNDSRLSLGVVNRAPVFDGTPGGLSVDASNGGYFEEDLKDYLGEYYDEVMDLINASVQKHDGVSPALKTVQRAATNLDLLLKIIKDYTEDARKDFIKNVLKQDNILPDILNYFSNDSDADIRAMVASNKKTPAETLIKIVEGDRDGLLFTGNLVKSIAQNPSMPGEILASLYNKTTSDSQMSKWDRFNIQREIAKNPSTPVNLLTDIFNTFKEKMNSNDPEATKFGDLMLGDLSENPSLPQQILEELFNNDVYLTSSIKHSMALNPSLPAHILEKLANDESFMVRAYTARNPKLPEDIMERLSEDDHETVRSSVAYWTKDPNILDKLADDESWRTRERVAKNKSTSESTLEKLINDRSPDARMYAKINLRNRSRNRQVNERKRYSLKFLYN